MYDSLRGFGKGARITVRPYLQSDRAALRSAIREIGERVLGHGLKHWEEAFEFQRGPTWTAEVEGRAVGFAGTEDYGNGAMLFHSDVVHPEWHGRGAGTALTLARVATTDPSEIVCLGLLATEHSRVFYERCGFQVEGDPAEDPFYHLTFYQMAVRFTEERRDAARRILQLEGVRFGPEGDRTEPREQVEDVDAE